MTNMRIKNKIAVIAFFIIIGIAGIGFCSGTDILTGCMTLLIGIVLVLTMFYSISRLFFYIFMSLLVFLQKKKSKGFNSLVEEKAGPFQDTHAQRKDNCVGEGAGSGQTDKCENVGGERALK